MVNYKTIGTRRFHELNPGDIFKALIHDIRPSEVTIRFSGGELYTARSMVLPEARIGEESLFAVKENDFEGRIVLEMVKSDDETKKTNMLTAALANAGIAVTPEMLKLARCLIDNALPVDAQTLNKAALLATRAGDESIESVIKSLREDMRLATVPETKRYTFDMRV